VMISTDSKIAHSFENVNMPGPGASDHVRSYVTHHIFSVSRTTRNNVTDRVRMETIYGVSPARRLITGATYVKQYDRIRSCLRETLGLTKPQARIVMRLLSYWSYFGSCYPKAVQVAAGTETSQSTFWRTVAILRELNLVEVINRYLPCACGQISNAYRLDRLALLLARYLAEHSIQLDFARVREVLGMSGRTFWRWIYTGHLLLPKVEVPGPAGDAGAGDDS